MNRWSRHIPATPLAAVLLWAALMCFPAWSEERIHFFDSEIRLHTSGIVEVTETIRVNIERRAIRHGIYRDFPTHYKGNGGLTNSMVGFAVDEVFLDGQPVPFKVQKLLNGKRIRIGSADYLAPPGVHEYTIRYRTDRQLAFSDGLVRFWWNVTGSGWQFPIDAVRVVIQTPPGAAGEVVEQKAWLGKPGSKNTVGVRLQQPDSNTLVAETTRVVAPGEGLTVWYLFPEKHFDKPGFWQKALWFFSDNLFGILGFLGLLWFPVYYYRAWDRVGRDPAAGAIVARFKPPRDLSPAAVRYIWKENADDKAFAAALLNLAVKGFAKLEKLGRKSYSFSKRSNQTERGARNGPLSNGEKMVLRYLNSQETLGKEHNPRIRLAKRALSRFLQKEHQAACYRDNDRYTWFGLGISMVLVVLFWLHFYGDSYRFSALAAAVMVMAMVVALVPKTPRGLLAVVGIALPWIFAIKQQQDVSVGFFAVVLLLIGINVLFAWLLKSPTSFGRKVLDEIEGFRLFLSATEQDRFEKMHPPEKTPELFEKYLPYALALGVENQWAEQFEDVLRAASTDPDRRYQPDWYSSYNGSGFSPRMVASSVTSGLASSVAAAATPPRSSGGSGFSGGGFSGGGGGGGGGW